MNPKYSLLALTGLLLAGCASVPAVPAETAEERESRCEVLGVSAAMSQDGKNQGMTQEQLDGVIAKLNVDPQLSAKERANIIDGVRKGFVAPEGADPGIIGQKTFDDCVAGK